MTSSNFSIQRRYLEKRQVDIVDDNRFTMSNNIFTNILCNRIKDARFGDTEHYPLRVGPTIMTAGRSAGRQNSITPTKIMLFLSSGNNLSWNEPTIVYIISFLYFLHLGKFLSDVKSDYLWDIRGSKLKEPFVEIVEYKAPGHHNLSY